MSDLESALLNDNKYYVKWYWKQKRDRMGPSTVCCPKLDYLSKPLILSINSSCPVRA